MKQDRGRSRGYQNQNTTRNTPPEAYKTHTHPHPHTQKQHTGICNRYRLYTNNKLRPNTQCVPAGRMFGNGEQRHVLQIQCRRLTLRNLRLGSKLRSYTLPEEFFCKSR